MLMTSPMKVRTLGEILRQREAVDDLLQQPAAALPNALVQVIACVVRAFVCLVPGRRVDAAWYLRHRAGKVPGYLVVDGGQLQDLELALAVGGDDGGGVADLLAEQRAADGRGGGDEALGDVGLFAGDELVGDLLVLAGVEDDDRGAEADLVVRNVREVDHGELAHALLQLAEAGVDEHLALLGHVVFGVFAEVAKGDSLLDLGGQLGA